MLPYLIVLILLITSNTFDRTYLERLIFIILSIYLLIFSAFRVGGTGPKDYDKYLDLYSRIIDWDSVINPTVHAEIGFRLLSYWGNILGLPPQSIIVAMAILALIPVIFTIKKSSYYPIFSLLIWMPYFLTMNMHSSRVSVAAGFGLLCINAYYQSRKLLFVVFFVIAFSFHTSSIILALLILTKLNYRYLISILICSTLIIAVIDPFEMASSIFNLLGLERASWAINSYKNSEDYGYAMSLFDPRILLSIGLCFLIYNIRKSVTDTFDIFYFKAYFIGTIILILMSSVTILSWRLSYYFLISGVISIPKLSYYYNLRFFKSLGRIRVMTIVLSLIFFLYVVPLIIIAEPYSFYYLQ